MRRRLDAREARFAGRRPPLSVLLRITLAYDGTSFEGWQSQSRRGGVRTVQGEVEAALAHLAGGGRVAVTGAGRTDAGVHAEGQVAAFDLPREMAPEELQRALNGLLPEDVRVVGAARAPDGFHPRRDALSKVYRYVLDTALVQLPTRRRTAGHVPCRLDPARVHAVAALYLGRRDFASLASAGGSVRTTVRHVVRSEARFEGQTLVFETAADGFLRRMVRSMVGGLVAAGRGVLDVGALERALQAGDRRLWPPPAPARGLTLVRVDYRPESSVIT